jgi:hypothetical protein
LHNEIKRRRPAEPEPVPEPGDGGEDSAGEVVVEADDLVKPLVIASSKDMDSLLASIREKLAGLLKANKRIRIKGRG